MKHRIFLLAALLAVGVSAPTLAQTSDASSQVRKFQLTGPKLNQPAAESAATDKARFGCDARAPNVCHFQIFYARGGRAVVLTAGMKATIPDLRVGSDGYCVEINKRPAYKCARKTISATYNN